GERDASRTEGCAALRARATERLAGVSYGRGAAKVALGTDRRLPRAAARPARGHRASSTRESGTRRHALRLGRRNPAPPPALLPPPGAIVPRRVRQHPERREPRPYRLAR